MQIVKRDGTKQDFDVTKIENAIRKAADATQTRVDAIYVAQKVKLHIQDGFSVEQIQDIVESELMESGHYETAKAYILYRRQRTEARDNAAFMSGLTEIVNGYLGGADWRVNENANSSFSLSGLNGYLAGSVTARYWLNNIYPENIAQAHKDGDLHLHDLSQLSDYCAGWDLHQLLRIGFGGVKGKTQSKPAKHLSTALGQIVNFVYTISGEIAGAVAFSSFDTLLAPFVRHDNLSYEQVKQLMQEFIFNMNIPTRQGFQNPFSNLTFDLVPSVNYRDQAVIVGGKAQDTTYGEYQAEMDMINRAFCEAMLEGDSTGAVFTFPIPTYNITRDFDWNNDNLETLWKMTAKYGIPYFSNYVNSELKPEDATSMCCRLRVDRTEIQKRSGGLFASVPMTGSIAVVTLNLPRLGYVSKDRDEFYDKLSALMDLARDSLEIKRKTLERLTENGLYPYCAYYLKDVKARNGSYWSNHFSTIGLVGMHECCVNLLGVGIETQEGQEFAQEVLKAMRNRVLQYQKETGNLYNLEATPAEGTSYRLAKIDAAKYPYSYTSGNDAPYYTNSTQLPVNYTDDMFEMLEHQEPLQTLYTGGTVAHLFLGEQIDDWRQARQLIKLITSIYKIPYLSLTPTFSVCETHGYLSGKQETCPYCGAQCQVYSRVVGYLAPVSSWNIGKKEEMKDRKTYAYRN